jgi:hypothetical protein
MPRQAPISATHPASQHVVTNGRAVVRQLSVLGTPSTTRQATSAQSTTSHSALNFQIFCNVFNFETDSESSQSTSRPWREDGGSVAALHSRLCLRLRRTYHAYVNLDLGGVVGRR